MKNQEYHECSVEKGFCLTLEKIDWKNTEETNAGNQSAATNTGDRSIEDEWYSLEMDAKWKAGELARKAACYALPPERRQKRNGNLNGLFLKLWPFHN